MKIGDLVRHVNEGWWGIIVEIRSDSSLRSKWFEIYCSEKDHVYGRWSSQVELVV